MSVYPHDLTSNRRFQDAIQAGGEAEDFGFHAGTEDVRRVIGRYRVANSFRGAILDGFSEETRIGYNALFRLFLVWSVCEQFLKIIGIKQEDAGQLLDAYDVADLCEKIKKHDKNQLFYSFVLSQVNPTHRAEVEKLLQGQELNGSYLASAIRHIFAHGKLSPWANTARPKDVAKICDAISEFFLKIIDLEFSKRVEAPLSSEATELDE